MVEFKQKELIRLKEELVKLQKEEKLDTDAKTALKDIGSSMVGIMILIAFGVASYVILTLLLFKHVGVL